MTISAQSSLFPAHTVKEKKSLPRQFPDLAPAERQAVAGWMRSRAADLAGSHRQDDRKLGSSIAAEADRFCRCGSDFVISSCDPCRADFRSPISCNSRLCSKCGRRIVKRWREPVTKKIRQLLSQKRKGWGVFLVTLTTQTARYDGLPTRREVRRLHRETSDFFRLFYGRYEAHVTDKNKVIETKRRFAYVRDELGKKVRVRRDPIMRQGKKGTVEDWRVFRGAGAVAALELGTHKGTNRAGELNNNIHVHSLGDAPYISQKRRSEAWQKITGDSFIVDIRAVNTVQNAVWYVLKYLQKPPAVESLMELANYAEAVKGSRRIKTSGAFYNSLEFAPKSKLKPCCPGCNGLLEFRSVDTIPDLDSSPAMPLWPLLFRRARGEPVELVRRPDPILENARRLIAGVLGKDYLENY